MKIGVTGTRHGMTALQEQAFRAIVQEMAIHEFHHGDCVGVDEEAVAIVRQEYGEVIHTHPPLNSSKRANVGGRLYVPKEYIERNHDIVDVVDMLIVVPREFEEIKRSGTWATHRYAMKCLKHVAVINPNGHVQEHHP